MECDGGECDVNVFFVRFVFVYLFFDLFCFYFLVEWVFLFKEFKSRSGGVCFGRADM